MNINYLSNIKDINEYVFNTIPTCMPMHYKENNDPIKSYQNFYNFDKYNFATYPLNEEPSWFKQKNLGVRNDTIRSFR